MASVTVEVNPRSLSNDRFIEYLARNDIAHTELGPTRSGAVLVAFVAYRNQLEQLVDDWQLGHEFVKSQILG